MALNEMAAEPLGMLTYSGAVNNQSAVVEVGEYFPTEHDFMKMDEALEQARLAGLGGDTPIGCVYVAPDGQSVATQTREFRDQNLLGHAEHRGYNLVQGESGRDLSDYTLYTTMEPCFGCAYMLDKGNLGRLFISAWKGDAPDFFRNPDTLDHIWSRTRRQLIVIAGLRKLESLELFETFDKRH